MKLTVDIKKRLAGFELEAAFGCENGVTGLLGESGSGKSVTLKCIAGIMRPDAGYIALGDRVLFDSIHNIDIPPQRRRVGLLLQGGALFPNMDVERNILAGRRELDRACAISRAAELMERFGLMDKRRAYPAQLSGGQAQRCALARLLMGSPDILLLDEPLTALDSTLKWKLEQELADTFSAFPGPVIYVTHDRGEAYRLCDDICAVERGRTRSVLDKHSLFEAPGDRASAMLTGCKNISAARITGENRLFAKDWGVELGCSCPIEDACALGVRAHSISLMPVAGASAFTCRVRRVTEDVFERVVTLITPGGAPIYAYIGSGVPAPIVGADITVYIAAEAVMPLRG